MISGDYLKRAKISGRYNLTITAPITVPMVEPIIVPMIVSNIDPTELGRRGLSLPLRPPPPPKDDVPLELELPNEDELLPNDGVPPD